MDQQAIEDVIIELLAEHQHTDPAVLRRELERLGDDLPIDSVLAAEVVARVESHCGVRLPTTAETAFHLKSVRRFAATVYSLVEEAAHGQRTG